MSKHYSGVFGYFEMGGQHYENFFQCPPPDEGYDWAVVVKKFPSEKYKFLHKVSVVGDISEMGAKDVIEGSPEKGTDIAPGKVIYHTILHLIAIMAIENRQHPNEILEIMKQAEWEPFLSDVEIKRDEERK